MGDFVALALKQAEAEGPDPALLEEALDRVKPVYQHFESRGHQHLQLKATIHGLIIKSLLAVLRRDVKELVQIGHGFQAIEETYGGPRGLLRRPDNFDNLLAWTFGACRHTRAMVDLVPGDYGEVTMALEALQRMLERAVNRAPRVATLWHEKAMLHLYRARQGLDPPVTALLAGADCMENTMDIVRSLGGKYNDPQVRAGWIGTAADLLADLAAIAAFALTDVRPPSMEAPLRMVCLA